MFTNLFKLFRSIVKPVSNAQPPKSAVVSENCDVPLLLTLEGFNPALGFIKFKEFPGMRFDVSNSVHTYMYELPRKINENRWEVVITEGAYDGDPSGHFMGYHISTIKYKGREL